MSTSKLMKVTYYDPKSQIRLLCYADTVVWDTKPTPTLTALRFGGYPERVQGLADAIYGGATIEIEDGKDTYSLKTLTRQYRRELSHDGVYAEATLIAEDDGQSAKQNAGDKDEPDKDKNDEDDDQIQQDLPPRNTYIFCTPGERRELFDAVDQKTAVPMIPEYQDYVLTELQKRNILRPLQVKSLSRKLEAWLLRCEEKDKNIVAVMEDGLKSGAISIPGATVGLNPLDEINSITEYLNTFGVTVAERIKKLFVPLFDPATESLSPEVLAINQYIEDHAGYPLYDAQLAVAEAIKRQLERSKVGLIVAECGSGKSKIGAVSIAATAAGLLSHQMSVKVSKTFKALAELHSGEPRIITKGKLPDSHIVFLDEIFKASDGILNALLTALNERRYTNEGKTIHIPTISFFSASNEIPNFANPEEKILKPLYDRFELKVVTEYVEDRDARLTILKQKQAAQGTAQNPSAVISLAELQAMQDEVLQVRVPDQVNELMDDVLCELRGKGIHISDRKYFNYAPIAQAKAWLSGRDTVEPSDLTTLCAYLWTAPEERTIIQSTLERMCNDPLKDRLDTILAEAVEGYQEFTDTADAPAARRIGKLRDEFMSLYITLSQMLSNAQSDAEREKINACLEELERYSKEAHASVQYSYVPLRELYDLKAS